MIRIHFAGKTSGRTLIPLAYACGVGQSQDHDDANQRRYEMLAMVAPELWQAASFEEADIVIYAGEFHNGSETQKVSLAAQEAGLPCLFFHWSDDATPAQVPYGTVFRQSIFNSQILECEKAFPAFADDLIRDRNGVLDLQPKPKIPTIGFCGFVGTPIRRMLYSLTGRRDKVKGLALRARIMKTLEQSPRIRTNFIRRDSFWGGAVSSFHQDIELQRRVRREYLDNIFESDYILCARGKGNFSYRFYEVLSAGRIPLFINTDCVLPLQETIDWKKRCVWVELADDADIVEKLIEFNESLDSEAFTALQAGNRNLWLQHLSPQGFYREVIRTAMKDSLS